MKHHPYGTVDPLEQVDVADAVLDEFFAIAAECGVRACVAFGLCLGLYRDGGYIVGDNDLDFVVTATPTERTRLKAALFEHGFAEGVSIPLVRCTHFHKHRVLVDVYWRDAEGFYTEFGEVAYKGKAYPAPRDIEAYLGAAYTDWRVPAEEDSLFYEQSTVHELLVEPAKQVVMHTKVREMCKSCKRFGTKPNCPPHVETVAYYRTLIESYRYGIVFYDVFPVTEDHEADGRNSSLIVHKAVLAARNALFAEGHTLMLALGGGSCKLCDECVTPCKYPDKALMPMEATGIDVVATMAKLGIDVTFPVSDKFYRIGAVFYD